MINGKRAPAVAPPPAAAPPSEPATDAPRPMYSASSRNRI